MVPIYHCHIIRVINDADYTEGHEENSGQHSRDLVQRLEGMNDPQDPRFTPTILQCWDNDSQNYTNPPKGSIVTWYTAWASKIVRHPTDVVMLTHLLLYLCTIVPSAILLLHKFSLLHAICHTLLALRFTGTYTLMLHQHVHSNGVLAKEYAWCDYTFPYILDPLMGHTWNSYYFHHIKHHHVENNGPDDVSSTLRYQRDNVWHFCFYVARFLIFVIWDLGIYFFRRGRPVLAMKAALSEAGCHLFTLALGARFGTAPAVFIFWIPLLLTRVGLMAGNWGQHALVDEESPDSNFRSSITLIDVPSNRYCFNDGYHTSHHLNPRRHWRDHPVAFLRQKERYSSEAALVFHDIDYLLLTLKLLQKDYHYIARRLVPLGTQIDLSLEDRVALLQRKTRRFTEVEIQEKFLS